MRKQEFLLAAAWLVDVGQLVLGPAPKSNLQAHTTWSEVLLNMRQISPYVCLCFWILHATVEAWTIVLPILGKDADEEKGSLGDMCL